MGGDLALWVTANMKISTGEINDQETEETEPPREF
jgi:hypothetical protein